MVLKIEKSQQISIWYQGYLEVHSFPEYQALLMEHIKTIQTKEVSINIHGMPKDFFLDTSPAEVTKYASSSMVFSNQILLNALKAEEQGYDGFALGTIQNLGLIETRSLIDIPVVSYGEAAMLKASQSGKKFAVLAFNPNLLELIDYQIKASNFQNNAMPSMSLPLEYNDIIDAFQNPNKLISTFMSKMKEVRNNKVDIIIPGQMVLAELLWKNQIYNAEGIEIIDAMKTTIDAIKLKILSKTEKPKDGFWHATPPKKLKEIMKKKLS